MDGGPKRGQRSGGRGRRGAIAVCLQSGPNRIHLLPLRERNPAQIIALDITRQPRPFVNMIEGLGSDGLSTDRAYLHRVAAIAGDQVALAEAYGYAAEYPACARLATLSIEALRAARGTGRRKIRAGKVCGCSPFVVDGPTANCAQRATRLHRRRDPAVSAGARRFRTVPEGLPGGAWLVSPPGKSRVDGRLHRQSESNGEGS